MFNLFKRKFKDKWKRAINMKIARPNEDILCPKCKNAFLVHFYIKTGAKVQCRKCGINGDSWGNYNFK
jgi:ribosomal protein S27E